MDMKKWLVIFVPSAIVAITGITWLGTVSKAALNIANGTPISTVIEDVSQDLIKETAINTIYGNENDSESISKFVQNTAYKAVSDKKQSITTSFKRDWWADCYRIDNYVFFGNRNWNKAKGANLKWNMYNATDFEIASYKDNVAYNDTYIAYDSKTFTLLFNELKKGKLHNWVVVYDEYYNTVKIDLYSNGKFKDQSIIVENNSVKLLDTDKNKIVAILNSENNTFEKTAEATLTTKIPKDISINIHENNLEIITDDFKSYIDMNDNNIAYESKTCKFNGNAFKFMCEYVTNAKKEDAVTYDYTVMQAVKMTHTDGTLGELKVVSDEPNNERERTIKSISIALIKAGAHATVEVMLTDKLAVIDFATQLTLGVSLTDAINDVVDDVIDTAVDQLDNSNDNSEDIEDTDENLDNNNTEESQWLEDKLKDLEDKGVHIQF